MPLISPVRTKIYISVFLTLAVGSMFAYIQKSSIALDTFVNRVFEECHDETDPNACYQKEIPKLANSLSMEDVFLVIEKAQALDPAFWFCHTLSHELASIEVKRDENKWQEVLHRCPMHQCGSGCLHGTFIAKFQHFEIDETNREEIIPELNQACQPTENWQPDGEEQASCRHSIGHALVFLTRGDLPLTTSLCDHIEVPNKDDFTENCYEGAFMQIYQPRTQEEFELSESIMPTRDTYQVFCSQFREDVKNICLKESWVLFESQIEDEKWLTSFCSYSSNQKENFLCYKKMFYVTLSKLDFYNSSEGKNRYYSFCGRLANPWSQLCQALPSNGVTYDMFRESYLETNEAFSKIDTKSSQDKKIYQEKIYASAVENNTITIKNCQGSPYITAVNQGTSLTFANQDAIDHTLSVSAEIEFDLPKNSTFSVSSNTLLPGIYGYSCDSMSKDKFGGMIVVK